MKEFINKLIEEMQEIFCDGCTSCKINQCDGVDREECSWMIRIKDTVTQLSEEYNDGWIPVSSGKLPDDGVPVEVTVKEDNDNGGFDLYVFESWYQDGSWVISKNRYNPTVIAWKPKDAPYQPKGE